MSNLVLALDVGGSSIKSALVETGPRIVDVVSVTAINSKGSAAKILNTLARIITSHLQKFEDVRGVAFAFPGPFNYEQGICLIQNLNKYDTLYGLNISTSLREILSKPGLAIRYRNDAEAAILGEALYGAGAQYSRMIGLTLGTGLGSAFIANGTLVTEGSAVPNHGWLYPIPYGTQRADDIFSSRGLLHRLREYGIVAATIPSAIRGADKGKDAFASFGADLGRFLTPFVSDFNAEAVLVTGGIAEAWSYFAPSLRRALSVPAVKGTLGKRAPLLGAAALYFS